MHAFISTEKPTKTYSKLHLNEIKMDSGHFYLEQKLKTRMAINYYQEDYIYIKTPDDNHFLLLILDPELEDKVLSRLVDLDDDKEKRPTKEDPHETPQATGQLPDVISI